MTDTGKFIFSEKGTAREALQLINDLAIPNVALFIVNESGHLTGSLTDGDIRRGLLKGLTIDDGVTSFMHTGSKHFVEGKNNFNKAKEYKITGIRFVPMVDSDSKIIRVIDLEKIHSIIPADVVLMAGGLGHRLRPLTEDTPKPLLKVGDKSIIERNLSRLTAFGIHSFFISVRYLAEKIIDHIGKGDEKQVMLRYIHEEHPLGTIGAIKQIEDFREDTILVMNADLLTNIDFEDFYSRFISSGADMAVATIPYHIDIPYAVMEIDEEEYVRSFKEKPRYTYYSNAGIYFLKKEIIELIPENTPFDATHLMEKVIREKKKLISYPILGYWLDIGRIDDYYKAQEDVKHIQF